MTVGLSLLTKPIWMIFYGYNELGFHTFSFSIFVALFLSLFSTTVTIVQLLKDYKYVIISLIVGFLLKLLLNIPLINLFNNIGLTPHFGSITATIIGYFIPFMICIIRLKTKYKIVFHDALINSLHVLIGTCLMAIIIIVFQMFIPIYSLSRMGNIPLVIIYVLVGLIIYILYMWKTKVIENIFGKNIIKKILKRK